MHPILSRLRTLIWYVFACVLVSAVVAWGLVAAGLASWGGAIMFALPALQLYGFIITSAYYVCRSLPYAARKALQMLTVFGCSSIASSLGWLGLCLLWSDFISAMGIPHVWLDLTDSFFILLFASGVVLYLVSLLIHDVLIAFDNIRSAERRQAATQVVARDAELQVLRSQINPHFLFNSLNSISALTSIDAAAARDMAIELGSFYRKTLAISEHQKIALGEEIALCEHFLAIEKIRFGDRLQVFMVIEPASLDAQVPAMFLQPLIENAIKHGICNLSDGGQIDIKIFVHQSWLHLSICNPIALNPSNRGAGGTGTGLKNFKARIGSLYGENARISWQIAHHRFCVEMIIPFEITSIGNPHE
jgi:two-component system sensor histidine kinase AlgZ